MNLITTRVYYRLAQVASVLLLPALLLALVLVEVEDRIVVDGQVVAETQATLASPLEKVLVQSVGVEPGTVVEAGQVLVVFADLQGWRLALAEQEKRLAFWTGKAKAMAALERQGAGAGLTTREACLQQETLELSIAALRAKVARLSLRAPFAGQVTAVHIDPGASVAIGTELITLVDPATKVVRCGVPENRVVELRRGQQVAIKSTYLNYLRHRVFQGTVGPFSPFGEETAESHLFETTVLLDADGREVLKVGTSAQCEIVVSAQPLYQLLLKGRG